MPETLFKPDKIYLLDGGVGQELVNLGVPEVGRLWGGLANTEYPELVSKLHQNYLDAGCDILTVNNYTITRMRLRESGIEHKLPEILERACTLARDAITKSGKTDVRLAGSMPPLQASYRPDMIYEFDEALEQYRELAQLMKDAVDVLFIETISDSSEARAALQAANEVEVPAVVSWTVTDERPVVVRGGETVTQAAEALADCRYEAMMTNCSKPEVMSFALDELRQIVGAQGIIGTYANGFEAIPKKWLGSDGVAALGNRQLTPEDYLSYAKLWLKKGAGIVGGCCHIGPDHIAALRAHIDTLDA